MIKLHQFAKGTSPVSFSSFCAKAEILLIMAGLEYENVDAANPGKAPTRTIPYIEDEGVLIGDSARIQRHITQKYGFDFDAGLDAREKAIAHAFARMLEERTYWTALVNRWKDEQNWSRLRERFFGSMPPVIRNIVPAIVRRSQIKRMDGHGIGRHSMGDVYEFGCQDVRALAALLGDSKFMMGDRPCSLDAIAFSTIYGLNSKIFPSPMRDELQRHARLSEYNDRCLALWFGGQPAIAAKSVSASVENVAPA